eukprot:TRINITY_DN73831_c0_g1_i1.p3 TRINITY_DN73831_c0_g1~~TRINITY_DN73831_c0_g1_i1.p3  ORF type:complete len:130 (+),score=42.83 TRINITY_DN73831_c0_g1_i1:94-483(+)
MAPAAFRSLLAAALASLAAASTESVTKMSMVVGGDGFMLQEDDSLPPGQHTTWFEVDRFGNVGGGGAEGEEEDDAVTMMQLGAGKASSFATELLADELSDEGEYIDSRPVFLLQEDMEVLQTSDEGAEL